jgi:hypothetical protein
VSALFPWTERDLLDRLRDRLQPPDWAYAEHVRYDLPQGSRTADAVAMSLDGGLALHAFEVKTSRGDWLRELADPGKAEVFASRVDYFWVVACDPTHVRYAELPERWGLLVPVGAGLRPVREAVRLRHQPRSGPWNPVDRALVAALLRAQIRALERRPA